MASESIFVDKEGASEVPVTSRFDHEEQLTPRRKARCHHFRHDVRSGALRRKSHKTSQAYRHSVVVVSGRCGPQPAGDTSFAKNQEMPSDAAASTVVQSTTQALVWQSAGRHRVGHEFAGA
jgi:hypothetical protein